MLEQQVQRVVTEIVAAAAPNPVRFYHLCWWEKGLRCLHVHHTTEAHPIFLSVPGKVLAGGLSPSQWRLLTERLAYFCQMLDVSLDARTPRAQSPHDGRPVLEPRRVTESDRQRLRNLLAATRATQPEMEASLRVLERLLETADVVPPTEIGDNVVTMNSQVRLWNSERDDEMVLSLVFPPDARSSDFDKVKLSILTHTGLSMLGRKIGDTIDGCLKILALPYQPEAAGDFDL